MAAFIIHVHHRHLTFLFCYSCNCVTSVTREDFRPPGLSPAVRARAHRAVVISITRGGSVAGERFNLVILIARGEGDGDPRGGREVSAVPSLFLYPRYFNDDCLARSPVVFVALLRGQMFRRIFSATGADVPLLCL